MSDRTFCLFACFIVTFCLAAADPISFIKPCTIGDNKCLKESAQAALPVYAKGVPEIGVTVLDPLFIPKLDASTSGLKLIITDATVTGLKDCRIKKFQRDVPNSKLTAKVLCDVSLEGQYEMSGRLLILPIEGKGPIHVKLRKAVLNAEIDLEDKTGKDGKNHWNIKSWKHSYELKDKADVVFENLFNGNEVLGRAARELVAASGNEIVYEVGPPVIKSVCGQIVKNVNGFFHAVPTDDFVLA